MRAWIRWCCCGWCRDCIEGKDGASSDSQGLLTSRASQDLLPLKESTYFAYDVRHISSDTTRAEMVESWLRACISGSLRKTQERSTRIGTPKRQDHGMSGYRKLSTEYDGLSFDRAESRETLALGDAERSFVAVGCGAHTSLSAPAFALVRGSQPNLGVDAATLSPAPTWCCGGEESRKTTPDPAGAWNAVVAPPSPSSIKDFGGATHSISRHSSLSSPCRTFALSSPCEELLARWKEVEGGCGDFSCGGGGRMRGGDDGPRKVGADSRKSRSPWHATLSRFRLTPARSRSKSPLPDGGTSSSRLHRLARLKPEITLSTPDLAKRSKEKVGRGSVLTLGMPSPSRMGVSTSCLPQALTAEVQSTKLSPRRSPFSTGGFSRLWSASRSMESVNLESEPCTPAADDVFQDGRTSSSLARSHGLDVSLYNLQHSRSFSSSYQVESLPSSPSNVPVIKVDSFENTFSLSQSNDDTSYLSNYGFHWKNDSYADQPCGSITFTASYNQKNKKLCIELERVENLPPKGKDSVYDVIVRLSLLPAEKHVKTTNVVRGSLNPEINESFSFSVKDPVGKIMRFSIFNSMFMGKHDAIGHACFNVEDVMSGKPRKYSMKLTRQSQPSSSCGLLQVYFQLSEEHRLIVDAIQARNLCMASIPKANRSGDAFNTYVKITFYCAGQKVKSKKSSVITCDRNPQYEFSNDFKIVPEYLDNCYVVLSVILKMSLRRDVTLGRYILGPNFFTGKQEITPWGQAILQREQICHWFHLYL